MATLRSWEKTQKISPETMSKNGSTNTTLSNDSEDEGEGDEGEGEECSSDDDEHARKRTKPSTIMHTGRAGNSSQGNTTSVQPAATKMQTDVSWEASFASLDHFYCSESADELGRVLRTDNTIIYILTCLSVVMMGNACVYLFQGQNCKVGCFFKPNYNGRINYRQTVNRSCRS